ncbi:collagen, type XII, alpha [Mytilus galloprovincialis]|uniref:Collagen, type XII, alpha n=1 Tax=Mytilus galloprovincialis TaxID=29158 RepID=A0A8B6GXW5_MYTGA|nr:collagen, type XII, alpha [Mytilus galloprovincialis]
MWMFTLLISTVLLHFAEQSTYCPIKADIVLLIDSSGSVGKSNFQKQIDFVKDFVNRFSIGSTKNQFSVVTFATAVNNEFWLNKYMNKQGLMNALKNITYNAGSTNTHLALDFVRQNSFLSANGGRPNFGNIVIILTDGKSDDQSATKKAAEDLHMLRAQVISVGIGSGADILELEKIASDKQYVVHVENFDALKTIETKIQYVACQQTSDFWIWILVGFGSCLILGLMFKLCWFTNLNFPTEKRNKRKISSAWNEEKMTTKRPIKTRKELDF